MRSALLAGVMMTGFYGSAHASTSLIPRLDEVDDAVKNITPHFSCTEPGDKESCNQSRLNQTSNGEIFFTADFANGDHNRCFFIANQNYGLCKWAAGPKPKGGPGRAWAVRFLENGNMEELPQNDERCKAWGDFDTIEYITCEAAQTQKIK